MEQLWAAPADPGHQGLTVREVHAALATDRDIAYTTVMTVLDRMTSKGLVEREREGRAWRYRPTQSRAELAAEMMREVLEEFAQDDRSDREAALAAFVTGANEKDRKVLRDALGVGR